MSEHTLGRLKVVLDGTCSGTWPHLTAADGSTVAERETSHIEKRSARLGDGPVGSYVEFPCRFKVNGQSGARSLENARRLVACWNACEGIETDDIEAHSVNIIHKLHDDAAKRVLSERDELLAALKELAHTLDSEHLLHDDQRAAFAQARAAIAKAGGAVCRS